MEVKTFSSNQKLNEFIILQEIVKQVLKTKWRIVNGNLDLHKERVLEIVKIKVNIRDRFSHFNHFKR